MIKCRSCNQILMIGYLRIKMDTKLKDKCATENL